MDEREQLGRRRQAQIRLRAQRRRVGVLRTRVITVSVVCLALFWAIVFVQMATGNDPVIGEGRRGAGSTAHTEETTEVGEPEPVEVEVVESEPEPEPLPVETAQS